MINSKDKLFFEKLLGKENAFFDTAHKLAYSYDATRKSLSPDGVLFPRNEADVQAIMRYCNEKKIVVIARGAGSGFTGGALASSGGLILAFEKHMNKILEIDEQNLLAIVEPGIVNKDLQKAVEKKGLFYPPDPASEEYSTIGGNVSENAGGMRAAKYGITKDYVLALRAVLPNGDLIRAGKKTIKDVAGYNIAGMLIASEGSLAVLTQITLKLIAKPRFEATAIGVFNTTNEAMQAVYKTFAKGVSPVAMEFLDNLSIRAVEQKFSKGLPTEAAALLIVQVDANTTNDIKYQLDLINEIFTANGAQEFRIAQNEDEAKEIWFARKNASQAITVYGPTKLNEDITVPRSALPDLLKKIQEIGKRYDHQIPCFGHTGDGNVHVNVMTDSTDSVRFLKAQKAIVDIFQAAIDLEGTLSGEHGIGMSKAPYMKMAFTKEEMELFSKLKKCFDSNNILNPNKMGIS